MVASILCFAAIAASSASAGSIYCNGGVAGGGNCLGPAAYITQNLVDGDSSSHAVCSGALDQSSNFYGQYWCASLYACHTYAGTVLLTPAAHNHESFTQTIQAYYYVNTSDPLCPRGGPLAISASAKAKTASVSSGQSPGKQCLEVPDSVGLGITCASSAAAQHGQLMGTMEPGDGSPSTQRTLYAVAPPATVAASIITPDGNSHPIQPSGGIVKTLIPRTGTSKIVWQQSNATTTAVAVPTAG